MKKVFVFGGLFALMCTMIACGDKTKSNPEADSLRTQLSAQMEEMDEMNLFLDAVNMSMDSVILQQQRERLDILEKKLKDNNAYAGKMQKTIAALKQQLEEKDQAIIKLSEELEQRNFQIEELKDNVDNLNVQVAELEEDSKAKQDEIDEKVNQMNEAYVFIGNKDALKKAGLIEGGSLLKKSKLNTSNIDKKLFKKVDIRNVKSFQIPDSKPEVLTQMPAGSYEITKTGNNSSELTITDPARFWGVSRFLIIRY